MNLMDDPVYAQRVGGHVIQKALMWGWHDKMNTQPQQFVYDKIYELAIEDLTEKRYAAVSYQMEYVLNKPHKE